MAMQRQRKWAIGILLCIVAVLLAIWVGVAKDEKDGDRESLYENEDYGLGVLDAAGLYGESVLYFRHGNGWKWVDGRIFCTGGGYADFLLLVSG